MTKEKVRPNVFELPRIIGYILAILGGIVAIGLALTVTHNASPLWAIILVIWGLERVAIVSVRRPWMPALRGLVLGVGYALLGVVAVYLQNAYVLWGMILVNWLAEALV
ncbi:hypothetical protein M1116_03460 [Patescibacteria group bacterium]|nr:hypothetical protein [Patescibacteria group bacterium]